MYLKISFEKWLALGGDIRRSINLVYRDLILIDYFANIGLMMYLSLTFVVRDQYLNLSSGSLTECLNNFKMWSIETLNVLRLRYLCSIMKVNFMTSLSFVFYIVFAILWTYQLLCYTNAAISSNVHSELSTWATIYARQNKFIYYHTLC